MQSMTEEEVKQFITTGTRTGKLATVRSDGRSHVAPIWFDLDEDGTLVFMTWHTSIKAKNIRRDPRVSICVDEEAPPYAFVIIEGTVIISEDPAKRSTWARRIGGRYMGADRAEEYGKRNGVAGELVLRVTPTKIIARKNVSD
jgi:PPOX class probable F420-dependent enzyme